MHNLSMTNLYHKLLRISRYKDNPSTEQEIAKILLKFKKRKVRAKSQYE